MSAAAPAKKAPRSDRSVKLDTDAARLLEVASLIEDRPLVDVLSTLVRSTLTSDPRVRAVMDAVSASPSPSA